MHANRFWGGKCSKNGTLLPSAASFMLWYKHKGKAKEKAVEKISA
jgi:hypothetical protein